MKFQFIPSPNRYERRIKFRSKQGIMSQENNNTSNRGLASADEETKERVAKPGGEAKSIRQGRVIRSRPQGGRRVSLSRQRAYVRD